MMDASDILVLLFLSLVVGYFIGAAALNDESFVLLQENDTLYVSLCAINGTLQIARADAVPPGFCVSGGDTFVHSNYLPLLFDKMRAQKISEQIYLGNYSGWAELGDSEMQSFRKSRKLSEKQS